MEKNDVFSNQLAAIDALLAKESPGLQHLTQAALASKPVKIGGQQHGGIMADTIRITMSKKDGNAILAALIAADKKLGPNYQVNRMYVSYFVDLWKAICSVLIEARIIE